MIEQYYSDGPEKCEVCEKEEGPFIKVEVSEEEIEPRWLLVCSDECLEKVANRNSEGKHLLGKQEADGKSILSES